MKHLCLAFSIFLAFGALLFLTTAGHIYYSMTQDLKQTSFTSIDVNNTTLSITIFMGILSAIASFLYRGIAFTDWNRDYYSI
jgi:ABC-type xylose transport system permease subunit